MPTKICILTNKCTCACSIDYIRTYFRTQNVRKYAYPISRNGSSFIHPEFFRSRGLGSRSAWRRPDQYHSRPPSSRARRLGTWWTLSSADCSSPRLCRYIFPFIYAYIHLKSINEIKSFIYSYAYVQMVMVKYYMYRYKPSRFSKNATGRSTVALRPDSRRYFSTTTFPLICFTFYV